MEDTGDEQEVALGMIIAPSKGAGHGGSSQAYDLTRSRGRSSEELLQMYQDRQKESAVASGKDYCKNGGQHTLRAGGVLLVAGIKRKELEQEEDVEDEHELYARRRQNYERMDHLNKKAAIEAKYCAKVSGDQGGQSFGADSSERLRLG